MLYVSLKIIKRVYKPLVLFMDWEASKKISSDYILGQKLMIISSKISKKEPSLFQILRMVKFIMMVSVTILRIN